jgi:arylsulfatase A-like enzyme
MDEDSCMRIKGVLAAAAIAGGLAAALAWRNTTARPSNLLLVTIDTLRADHTSVHGYPYPTTPFLAHLAAEGTVFESAYTPTPTTGPSHSTLFTSSYPQAHGVVKNGHALVAGRRTLAEVLRDATWRTAAFVSAFPLAARFGYARGFERYDDEFPLATASIGSEEWEGFALPEAFDRRADATTDRALAWLAAAPAGKPWFLWVHYYDPHGPYDPPKGYRRLVRADESGPAGTPLAHEIAGYDGEIRFVDEQLARLVGAADERFGAERTLLVVAADHGEGLMAHGWMEHGVNLYEELVRTFLLVRRPGSVRAGQRVAEPVGLIDVAPTVLTLLGVDPAALDPQGEDLSAVLVNGAHPPADRALFFQRRLYTQRDQREWPASGEMLGVRRGAWKYIMAPGQHTTELFDLGRDPGETHNLFAQEGQVAARLASAVDAWAVAQGVGAPGIQQVGADDAARLRALGYVE